MTELIPLFSGSSGNSCFIGDSSGGVLVDAGVSAKRLQAALLDRNIDPKRLAAVFITHEHNDHIAGLNVFCKRFALPVFAGEGTLRALEAAGVLDGVKANAITRGGAEANGLLIKSFATSHDAGEPLGYTVESGDGRFGVATDTGYITSAMESALLTCDTVLIESNHEVRMLQNGPYPYFLKRRILSDQGHLSNEACARFLPRLLNACASRFFLGHLSRENNTPALALAGAQAVFESLGAKAGIDYELTVAKP